MNRWLVFVHLVGAAVWLGGMISVGAIIPAMRRAGAERLLIQTVARRFGHVSWTALVVTAGTGIFGLLVDPDLLTALPSIELKVGLVAAAAALALWHQMGARNQSPGLRGAIQGSILVITLAVFAIAAGW